MRVARAVVLSLAVLTIAAVSGFAGILVGRHYERNSECCAVPGFANLVLSVKEVLRLSSFVSQIGQDKWVSETVFPGVKNGFFLDVGSGDGISSSNTYILERKGWRGICIDPFPTNMETRTCQVFKEVVFDQPGKKVTFHIAGGLSGVADTLGRWKREAEAAPSVEFTTTTLGDILDRASAPSYIHFMSLDIEGAELAALQGLPFDKYRFGAFAIEHNFENEKRDAIVELLKSHGYRRAHTWMQDDFFVSTSLPSQ